MNQKHRFPFIFLHVSSSYERYEERAKIYLQQVIAQVKHLQFYTEVFLLWESNTILAFPQNGSLGGPIIMTQIENEFGNYGYGDHPRDKVIHSWKEIIIIILLLQAHLKFLKSVLREEVVLLYYYKNRKSKRLLSGH